MLINTRQNAAFAAAEKARGVHTVQLAWEGEDLKGTTCQPQDMTIWEGIRLIGCPRGSGKVSLGVVQGVVYVVKQISDTHATLEMTRDYCKDPTKPPDPLTKEVVAVPLDDVAEVLRLTHALCYYTCQGRTMDSHVVLMDTEYKWFSRRALIVGLSRATHGDLVHVATPQDEEIFLGERRRSVRSRAVERVV